MKTTNRDLLVLVKDEFDSEKSMEKELEQLNKILFTVETTTTFCIVNEILDFNRYKVLSNPKKVLKVLQQDELKPFQYIYNKN